MSEIYQLPDNSGNNAGMGNIPFSIPIGGFGGGNGFGGGFGSMTQSADYPKEALKEDENKEKEQVFAIPAK